MEIFTSRKAQFCVAADQLIYKLMRNKAVKQRLIYNKNPAADTLQRGFK